MRKILLIALSFAFVATASFAFMKADDGDAISGIWFNAEKTAKVKVEKIGTKYYGRIVWLETPNDSKTGEPRTDKENPDESLKSTPLKGLRILKDLSYNESDKEWAGGTIYDPKNGKTYTCFAKMNESGNLDLKGYVMGMRAIGRTSVWTRP